MTTDALMTEFRSRIDRIRRIDAERVLPVRDRHRYSIKDVGKGGVLQLEGRTYLVEDISSYTDADENFRKCDTGWKELKLLDLVSGEVVWLEWEQDDEIFVSRTIRKLSFHNLSDDSGHPIDEDDLDDLADEKDLILVSASEVGIERKFDYADDYAAIYHRSASGRETRGDKVYFYEFVSGDFTVTIEEWMSGKNDYSYELFLSRRVALAELTIIALGKEG